MSEGGEARHPAGEPGSKSREDFDKLVSRAAEARARGESHVPIAEGGEARNHEEIEAVARLLRPYDWSPAGLESDRDRTRERAAELIAALDAVRCAQGRDTDSPEVCEVCGKPRLKHYVDGDNPAHKWQAARSPQGEDHDADALLARSLRAHHGIVPAPPSEDHELREKIADELTYNDECGSRHLASRAEYLADADAILRIVGEHERLGELLDGETT